ncbi:hypothetical protein CJD35_09540 [Sphingobium xenophagum]|uniref:Uncharacterized protein n=1 Tax=Sphingobium xenophagum TaxID=121428 RepID=A0A249MTZ1_SPHXE|nr:hypothetical protein [Sphingobium xenophagum]ASY44664.1 hypothetical protein CJD35_09540 [Sphingobium xenophagum]
MAVTSLQAESAQTNPTSSRALYYAYRRAKAAWDIALYAPELLDDDLAEEINEPLSEAHTQALNDFMLSPADRMFDLCRKLEVFRDEELANWYLANGFICQLASDARRLALDLRRP